VLSHANHSALLPPITATSIGDDEEENEDLEGEDLDDDDTTAAGEIGDRDSEGSNYAEDPILTILSELNDEACSQDPLSPLPKEVLSTIQLVTKKGILPYSWHVVKRALRVRLRQLCHSCWHTHGYLGPADTSFEQKLQGVLSMVDRFDDEGGPPFTIQRVAELACYGTQVYKSTHKLFNALEKCLQVETTLESVEEDCTLVEHRDSDFFRNSDAEAEAGAEGNYFESDEEEEGGESAHTDAAAAGDYGATNGSSTSSTSHHQDYSHNLNADSNEHEITVTRAGISTNTSGHPREEAAKTRNEDEEEQDQAAMQQMQAEDVEEQRRQQQQQQVAAGLSASPNTGVTSTHRHADMIALALGLHEEEKERRKRPRMNDNSAEGGRKAGY